MLDNKHARNTCTWILDTVLGASDYDALVPGWTGALALALVEPGLVELELVDPELVSTAVVRRRGYSDLGYAGLEG